MGDGPPKGRRAVLQPVGTNSAWLRGRYLSQDFRPVDLLELRFAGFRGVCAKSEAATRFSARVDFGVLNCRLAALAGFFPVGMVVIHFLAGPSGRWPS